MIVQDSNKAAGSPDTRRIDFSKLSVVDFSERPAPSPLLQSANALTLRPFSLLRSKVQQKLKDQGVTMLGITSAMPNSGKSSLSISLAASLAKLADRPVVLLDLDMRRGSIAEYLGLEVGYGLSDYLSNDLVTSEHCGVRLSDANLIVYPTNPINSGSAELLASHRFSALVASLREHPDSPICIFDLPPAFANDDTMIALNDLDGYLLVVENGKTSKRHVLDVLKMLAPAKCFGTILNRYDGMIGDSYSYGSAAYSKYYE